MLVTDLATQAVSTGALMKRLGKSINITEWVTQLIVVTATRILAESDEAQRRALAAEVVSLAYTLEVSLAEPVTSPPIVKAQSGEDHFHAGIEPNLAGSASVLTEIPASELLRRVWAEKNTGA